MNAVEMSVLRWKNKTQEQKSAQGKLMVEARKKKYGNKWAKHQKKKYQEASIKKAIELSGETL